MLWDVASMLPESLIVRPWFFLPNPKKERIVFQTWLSGAFAVKLRGCKHVYTFVYCYWAKFHGISMGKIPCEVFWRCRILQKWKGQFARPTLPKRFWKHDQLVTQLQSGFSFHPFKWLKQKKHVQAGEFKQVLKKWWHGFQNQHENALL